MFAVITMTVYHILSFYMTVPVLSAVQTLFYYPIESSQTPRGCPHVVDEEPEAWALTLC